MTVTGLVSIMMPAYNAARYIATAIDSVLAQDYTFWELLVVDDGSTDQTGEIVRGYSDDRIRLIRQENAGEAAARNTALEHIQGEYLAFLDADDLFTPIHLSSTVAYLAAHPEHDAVYTNGYHINTSGELLTLLSTRRRGPFIGDLFEQLVRASDVFGPPVCVLVRSQIVNQRNLRFDNRIVIGPDWDFFTRLAESCNFGYIDQASCRYRVHDTNITLSARKQVRIDSLVFCRQKAIQSPRFGECSIETQSYVFYDLLINLLFDNPQLLNDHMQWPQFLKLPKTERAKLLRLAAGNLVAVQGHAAGDGGAYTRSWLAEAQKLQPLDIKTYLLSALLAVLPGLATRIMALRYKTKYEKAARSPFEGINST